MIKHLEYYRHGMTEPLATLYIYKKVEDGKIVGTLRISIYRNAVLVVYESDKLEGGEVLDVLPISAENIAKLISKFYEPNRDDIVIIGEKRIIDEVIANALSIIEV